MSRVWVGGVGGGGGQGGTCVDHSVLMQVSAFQIFLWLCPPKSILLF